MFQRLTTQFHQHRYNQPREEPPTVTWLLQNRNKRLCETQDVTPTGSLYRMYEYVVKANNTGLRTEIEFFFNHATWSVRDIPDPKDADPQRYAILSVLPTFLVIAFNRLIERGLPRGSPSFIVDQDELDALARRKVVLEEVPDWSRRVPALEERLVIPDSNGEEVAEEDLSPEFLALNVAASQPHVLFV